jgi:hypothetical protein
MSPAFFFFISTLKWRQYTLPKRPYFLPKFMTLHPEDSPIRGIGDLNTGVFGMWVQINFKQTMK